MDKIKNLMKSVRFKLFSMLCIAVAIIIVFLILINSFVLETFYLYSKQQDLMELYEKINSYYNQPDSGINLELELEKSAVNNNFDIIIKTDAGLNVYTSNKDFSNTISTINEIESSVTRVV